MPSTNRTLASWTGWLSVLLPTSQRLSLQPAKRGLEIDARKHAINLSHELALIVEEIDDALNGIIATLGFNEHPVLFLMVSSGLNFLAATIHSLFSWSIGHVFGRIGCISSFFLLWLIFWLLVANWSTESWNPPRVERRSASRFFCKEVYANANINRAIEWCYDG